VDALHPEGGALSYIHINLDGTLAKGLMIHGENCPQCLPATSYLGGPMRALPLYNFPAFEAACKDLRAKGWTVWSPAEHDLEGGFDPATTDMADFNLADALVWDFQKIMESSYLIVLPGWEKSTGTTWEATVAYATGKPVLQYPELTPVDLPDVVTNPVQVRTAEEAAVRVLKSREAAADTYAHMRGVDGPGAYERHPGDVGPHSDVPKVGDWTFPPTAEWRSVDPITGGEKGSKPERFDLIPADVMEELARHYGRGCLKYEDNNWRKGYAWSLSIAALERHLSKFKQRIDVDHDPEVGDFPHLVAVIWHACALLWFQKNQKGTDDRA
jgi:dATP/dGTP diphosphohydrolase/uncharacterized protein DUF4406